ncbi:hypothetical protein ACOSP7_021169 [Xanthoceras sorbifolium]
MPYNLFLLSSRSFIPHAFSIFSQPKLLSLTPSLYSVIHKRLFHSSLHEAVVVPFVSRRSRFKLATKIELQWVYDIVDKYGGDSSEEDHTSNMRSTTPACDTDSEYSAQSDYNTDSCDFSAYTQDQVASDSKDVHPAKSDNSDADEVQGQTSKVVERWFRTKEIEECELKTLNDRHCCQNVHKNQEASIAWVATKFRRMIEDTPDLKDHNNSKAAAKKSKSEVGNTSASNERRKLNIGQSPHGQTFTVIAASTSRTGHHLEQSPQPLS